MQVRDRNTRIRLPISSTTTPPPPPKNPYGPPDLAVDTSLPEVYTVQMQVTPPRLHLGPGLWSIEAHEVLLLQVVAPLAPLLLKRL